MTYDLVIVGGGPAGSAAAIQAAQDGLACALIESEAFPRERPGETLHPGIEPLLAKLGITGLDFPRVDGIWSAWNTAPELRRFGSDERGEWRGFHAWRAEFDCVLLDRAKEAGCRVLQPMRAVRPAEGGVLTQESELKCRTIIDASGRRNWLARHRDLPTRYESKPQWAAYCYVHGAMDGPDPLIETDDEGWTWTARVKAGLTGWVRLQWSGERVAEGWRPPKLQHLTDARPVRHADVTWRRLEQPAGAGYFAVGDAAAVLDPSSSHGVLRAVMSGMMAAYLTARAEPEQAAAEYTRWLTAWFEHDLEALKILRKPFAHLPTD